MARFQQDPLDRSHVFQPLLQLCPTHNIQNSYIFKSSHKFFCPQRLRSENRLLRQRVELLEAESSELADRLVRGQVNYILYCAVNLSGNRYQNTTKMLFIPFGMAVMWKDSQMLWFGRQHEILPIQGSNVVVSCLNAATNINRNVSFLYCNASPLPFLNCSQIGSRPMRMQKCK